MIRLDEDMHVHSTFSDGKNTLLENLRVAEKLGLRRLGCVDHVREDTTWLPLFIYAIENLRTISSLEILACVEAKILDADGRLDVPNDLSGVDWIYAADHQLPLGDRCYTPREIRTAMEQGELHKSDVIATLLRATRGAIESYPRVVIAHLFSILPKLRISEEDVPLRHIEELARIAKNNGACIEIDERWRCPSLRTIRVFQRAGVPVWASTDSHRREKIGQYTYARGIAESKERA
ncbi:MAG: hypothetical protein JKY56_25670 [Kofleriaceae bacterium]|nr:hypothetical protein [Kofleriaceae bacterium]